MTIDRARPGLLMAALGGSVAVYCLLLKSVPVPGGDPVVAFESVGLVALAGWFLVGVRASIRSRSLARALDRRSRTASLRGVDCRVIRHGGRHAFVLGALRPRIYLGDGLLHVLDEEELRGVLLHEDHHRRTLAPLRTLAIEGWLALLGRWRPVRAALDDRLVDLEEAADAAAIERGVTPATLASALLKCDPGAVPAGAAFAATSDRRLLALLARADGATELGSPRLPYEWLPVAAVAVIVIACHLSGLSPLG